MFRGHCAKKLAFCTLMRSFIWWRFSNFWDSLPYSTGLDISSNPSQGSRAPTTDTAIDAMFWYSSMTQHECIEKLRDTFKLSGLDRQNIYMILANGHLKASCVMTCHTISMLACGLPVSTFIIPRPWWQACEVHPMSVFVFIFLCLLMCLYM